MVNIWAIEKDGLMQASIGPAACDAFQETILPSGGGWVVQDWVGLGMASLGRVGYGGVGVRVGVG